jgi:hypothetical protein
VHLVGFTIEIYYEVPSYKRQISGNILPTFRDNILVLSSWVKTQKENLLFGFVTVKDEIGYLSRNVGKELPPLAA